MGRNFSWIRLMPDPVRRKEQDKMIRLSATKNQTDQAAKAIDNSMTPYTVLATDETLAVNTTAGVVELLLPAAATVVQGKELIIYDSHRKFATNACTITPDGAEEVDGLASRVMDAIGEAAVINSNGVNGWNTTKYNEATGRFAEFELHDSVSDVLITAADVGAGGTGTTFVAQILNVGTGANTAAEKVFLVLAADTQYAGRDDLNANVTFGTATSGSILASGSGWAVVKTDATGEFACTITNAVDEQVWFSATHAAGGHDAVGAGVCIRGCAPDDATWS